MKKINGKKDFEILIQNLNDENIEIRWKAAEALGELGDSRAVEPLITALENENSDVREDMAIAIRSMGGWLSSLLF